MGSFVIGLTHTFYTFYLWAARMEDPLNQPLFPLTIYLKYHLKE